MSEWQRIKLKDICREITVGFVGPMAKEYTEQGIPFLRSQNILPFRLELSSVKYIDSAFHHKLSKSALHPGDVVVIRTGYPGVACVIPSTLPIANCADLVIIRPSPQLDAHFLTYLFNSTWGRGHVSGSLVGVAQQHFNVSAAKEMFITLPPLPIQRKIASVLSAYDDLIENNTRRIDILEKMAQALYREWFVHFRFPGHEKKGMVESALGMIPEGWEVVKLGDVATIYRGRSYASTNIVPVGGLPFLNLKCIERDGGFRNDGIKRYLGPYKETQTAKAGDIVIAVTDMGQERRIVARAARVPATNWEISIYSMDLVKIVPEAENCREYLYSMLRFSNFSDEVKQYANGVNVLHLAQESIENFRFSLAPKPLATRFSTVSDAIYHECDVLQSQNDNLRRTRDLLLPRLISGELDVERLDIETDEATSEVVASIEEDIEKSAEAALAGEQMMLWG